MDATLRVAVTTTEAPQLARILAVSYPSDFGEAPVTMTRRPDMSALSAVGLRPNNRHRWLADLEKELGMLGRNQRDSRDFSTRTSLSSHNLAPLSGSDAVRETGFRRIMCRYIPVASPASSAQQR